MSRASRDKKNAEKTRTVPNGDNRQLVLTMDSQVGLQIREEEWSKPGPFLVGSWKFDCESAVRVRPEVIREFIAKLVEML